MQCSFADSLSRLMLMTLLLVPGSAAWSDADPARVPSIEKMAATLEENARALGPIRLRYSIDNSPVHGAATLDQLSLPEGLTFGPAPTEPQWVDVRFSGHLVVLESEADRSVWFIDGERISEFDRRNGQLTLRHSRDNASISLWDPRDPFPPDIRHTTSALIRAASRNAHVRIDAKTGEVTLHVPYDGTQHLAYGLSTRHGFLPVWSELRNSDESVVRRVTVDYERIESRSAWLPRTISVTFPQAAEEAKKIALPVVAETRIEVHDVELTDEQALRPLAARDVAPARVVDMTGPRPSAWPEALSGTARTKPVASWSWSWLLWVNFVAAVFVAVAGLLRRR